MAHLAVVTGAPSGIGFELAKYALHKDYDLIIVADEPEIQAAADKLRGEGAEVIAVQADLSTRGGVDKLYERYAPVDVQSMPYWQMQVEVGAMAF
jgi:uncharacterized protein